MFNRTIAVVVIKQRARTIIKNNLVYLLANKALEDAVYIELALLEALLKDASALSKLSKDIKFK